MAEVSGAGLLALSEPDGPQEWPSDGLFPDRTAAAARSSPDAGRQADMARQNYAFIWRSLRRLGVSSQGVDDATQQVFVLVAEKIGQITPGCERAFLFQTAVRTAMAVRRTFARRREALLDEGLDELVDPTALPDTFAEEQQRRRYLDELLDKLPMELRTVFILFEIEGLGSPEIASMLEIPVGTVASRLRRARAAFHNAAERLRKRLASASRPGAFPGRATADGGEES